MLCVPAGWGSCLQPGDTHCWLRTSTPVSGLQLQTGLETEKEVLASGVCAFRSWLPL